jgi:multidrug efflux system membrane fusion protein
VPVIAARVRVGDIGVYLTGLGTATALQTVTVRSRVDGQLINVAFHEGQFVPQDDLLAELDPRPFQVQLTEAEGQAAKDEATLKNTQLDLSRYSDLFAKGLIPKQQLDTQAATLDQYEGGLKSDRGQIDSARLNLAYTCITAPISGRIGLRLVDPGNIVHATDQTGLVVITQIDPIGVLFTIPEDSLGQVLPHLRAAERLEVDAYDRDLKTKIAVGTLITVDNQIDQSTGTVKLKAQFPNNSAALFPNQFVNARLLVSTIRRALIVPSAAVQLSPRSKFV